MYTYKETASFERDAVMTREGKKEQDINQLDDQEKAAFEARAQQSVDRLWEEMKWHGWGKGSTKGHEAQGNREPVNPADGGTREQRDLRLASVKPGRPSGSSRDHRSQRERDRDDQAREDRFDRYQARERERESRGSRDRNRDRERDQDMTRCERDRDRDRDRERNRDRDRRDRDRDRNRDRDQSPPRWVDQLDDFLQRELLDEQFCLTIQQEPTRLQKAFVAQGGFDDVRNRKDGKGNPSAVAWSRLRALKDGTRPPLDESKYEVCRWCGHGNLKDVACKVCRANKNILESHARNARDDR